MKTSDVAETGTAKRDRPVVWVLFLLLASAVAAVDARVGALVVALGIVAVAWRFPLVVLDVSAFCILAMRPSLDTFSERRVSLGLFAISPSVIFGVVVLVVAGTLAVQRGRDGHSLWPDRQILKANLWLLAAYGIGCVSGAVFYGSTGIAEGSREAIRVASVLGSFLLILWWSQGRTGSYRLGWTLLVGGLAVPVIVALYQLVTNQGFLEPPGYWRIEGTFSHPNTFAHYLIPFIVVAVASLQRAYGMARIGRALFALGLTVLVVLTYSRTALIVLVLALVAIPVLQTSRVGWRGLARGALVVAVICGSAWWLAGDKIKARFADISFGAVAWDQAELGMTENSFTWRLVTWRVLIGLSSEHPIVGHGAGMTMVLDPVVDYRTGIPFHAHNDFVRFLFEGGALGLASYIIYGLLVCRWTLKRAQAAASNGDWAGYGVAASLLSIFFLSGGTADLSYSTALLTGLYGMMALLCGVRVGPIAQPTVMTRA